MTEPFNPGIFAILGFKGINPDTGFLHLMEKYPPAGFLLLKDNYRSPRQLASLISNLKSIVGDHALFAVDQEPGRVQRFKKHFPLSLRPAAYIEDALAEKFRLWCSDTASLLSEIGVNLNLAPVLDLGSFSHPNPVLCDRIFGDDPEVVAFYSGILIEEHKKKEILTCGKHFPGLGSAKFDPHVKLSVSREPFERFKNPHWKPFEKAVQSGIDLVMTTHLKAESLDMENPATYSSKIIGFLRNHVNYDGPVISDDLSMGGAGEKYPIGESALKSIESGHNLVIISSGIEAQTAALDCIKNGYEQNKTFRKIADENEKIIRQLQDKFRFSNS